MPSATQNSESESNKTEEISVTQLLLMHSRQERVTLTLYNFRILGSLGVLGFIYHNTEFTYNWMVKAGISLGFVLFAAGNGYGAVASQTITAAVSDALKKAAEKYGYTRHVLLAHSAISAERMTFYQIGLTIIALLLLWFPNIAQWCRRFF
jgi:hypothetical protein